jgi:hypothetical protein
MEQKLFTNYSKKVLGSIAATLSAFKEVAGTKLVLLPKVIGYYLRNYGLPCTCHTIQPKYIF